MTEVIKELAYLAVNYYNRSRTYKENSSLFNLCYGHAVAYMDAIELLTGEDVNIFVCAEISGEVIL